ncbi:MULTISPECIES: GyrI-like domain-containing protein [unclassified Pseudomonas]|uniref:GyrI-like domain-containing protein n=1 Tax=unclassified Pseudomonas TaxID=196821 RepID=UPI002AC95CEE|nr:MULTISPECIES: GyrI-like domain-containing protein [unclassified Pseudomonas]MEB0046290.1 GyrI-like domain-containing protein [Pseudomonas sp. Dout3]MEB0097785.1 GyrI-like domain-containing protein [Pseudomonas sp. DC1.2]WPX57631.1 GyrI-like domain-containing protein [Pseudomonas sp. DC1.2]
MDEQTRIKPAEPRFENGHFLLIAGLGGRFTQATSGQIPQLWEQFIPHLGRIPSQKGEVTYGVCCNPDGKGGFEYIAGVEISKLDDLPEKYRWVEVQPQHYAVFEHHGALDTLPQTFQYIWKTWLPQSGRAAADAPEFERYSEDFNPKLATGTLEIWLPLKA